MNPTAVPGNSLDEDRESGPTRLPTQVFDVVAGARGAQHGEPRGTGSMQNFRMFPAH